MRLTIHRGTHEIGGSCIEIAHAGKRIVLDIGLPLFGDTGEKFDNRQIKGKSLAYLQAKKILPDVKGFYSNSSEKLIDALLISHAHIDHYGLYDFVHKKVPIYLGEATKAIIDINAQYLSTTRPIHGAGFLDSGRPFCISPFTTTPFLMDHSAFDAYGFLIESAGKRIFYSGDFRGHGRKWKSFTKLLHNPPQNVDALLIEGTNIERTPERYLSESGVEEKMREVIHNAKGITLIAFSAQNIDRLVSVIKATVRDKTLVIDPYTAFVMTALRPHIKLPDLLGRVHNIRVCFPPSICKHMEKRKMDSERFRKLEISPDELDNDPQHFVMLVKNSMLSFLEEIHCMTNCDYIYSLWSGYRSEPSSADFEEFIKRKSFNVHQIHTSGHASLRDLRKLVDAIKPKIVIPVHTANPEGFLKYFPNTVVLKDGQSFDV